MQVFLFLVMYALVGTFISEQGIEVDGKKIEANWKIEPLYNISQVRSFLDL